MNNQEFSKTGKFKWIAAFVAIIMLVAAVITSVVILNNNGGASTPAITGNGGNSFIVTPDETNTMRLAVAPLAATDGISPLSGESYTVTATIQPASALQKADWSVAWSNAGSAWANGKTVTNYVTVTPTEDGSLTATVSCTAAFSEQIILTVKARANDTIKATCAVDYQQRLNINGITLDGSVLSTTAGNFKAEIGKMHVIAVDYAFSEGTIAYLGQEGGYNEFVCAGIAFTDELIAAYNANRGTAPALTRKMKRANVSSEFAHTRDVEFTDGAYGNTVFYQLMGYFSDAKMSALRAAINSVGEDNVFKVGVFKTTSAITDTYVECDTWYKFGLKASSVYMATESVDISTSGITF